MKHTHFLIGLIFALASLSFVPLTNAQNATCGEHVVASGETLFRIAQTYNTTVEAIAAANNIANPSQINAGQTLSIPCAINPVNQGRLGELLPITPASAEQVELLYTQEWLTRPIQLGVLHEDNSAGVVALLDEAGVLGVYSLDALLQVPFIIVGGEDGRFVYKMATSPFGTGLAVAEYFDTSGGSVVTVSGFPTTADPTIEINIPLEHGISLTDMALDGDLLFTTVGDVTGGPDPDIVPGIQMWPLLHGFAGELFIPTEAPVTGIAVGQSESARLVATAGVDGLVRVWDISSFGSPVEPGEAVLVSEIRPTAGGTFTGTSSSMAFSPDGRYLALGSGTGEIWLWNVANETLNYFSVLNNAPVTAVAFSPDSTVLAMSGGFLPEAEGGVPPEQDNFIHLFDVDIFASGTGGAFLTTLTGHTQAVTGLAFADSIQLVSIAADNTVRIWGVPAQAASTPPQQPATEQPVVAFSTPSGSGCPHTFFFGDVAGECVDSPPSENPGAAQNFEGGYMLWNGARGTILVLHGDGTTQSFPDTWNGQEIVTNSPPPAGLFIPERGFGWVWNDQVGIRDRLGWALGPEQPYTLRWQSGHVDSPDPRPAGIEYYSWPTGNILRLTYYDGAVLWDWAA